MDSYDRYEDSLNDRHDYIVCMANCPDGKDCGCGGNSDDPKLWLVFGLTILFFVIIGIIINAIATHEENKELREWREKYNKQKKEKNKKD